MLDLTLTLDRSTYTAGDTIVVKIVLRNSGTTATTVNARLGINSPFAPEPFRDVAFAITDPAGAEVEFEARINRGFPKGADFKNLAPNEQIEQTYAIQQFYDLEKPGKYSIQAAYQNQSDPGDGTTAWKGELKSNAVTFTVEA